MSLHTSRAQIREQVAHKVAHKSRTDPHTDAQTKTLNVRASRWPIGPRHINVILTSHIKLHQNISCSRSNLYMLHCRSTQLDCRPDREPRTVPPNHSQDTNHTNCIHSVLRHTYTFTQPEMSSQAPTNTVIRHCQRSSPVTLELK